MKKTKLAIFDIDGTLTKTNKVDHICYINTVQKFIDKEVSTFDPDAFTHFTDSSILIELYQHYLNRPPNAEEEKAFKNYYFEALSRNLVEQPNHFQALAGAPEVIHGLSDEWAVALATGCWVESAHIKLKGGGVDIGAHPLATASDAVTRQDIMLTAVERAKNFHQVDDFEHIVYIGDGLWDRQSCASLSMPFVGIDADNTNYGKGKLKDFHLLADYTNLEQVHSLLEAAKSPTL
jgi:phosphoglycolate phosphatase-like HAD superfamily hydrolase